MLVCIFISVNRCDQLIIFSVRVVVFCYACVTVDFCSQLFIELVCLKGLRKLWQDNRIQIFKKIYFHSKYLRIIMTFYIEFHLTIKLRNTDKFNIFIIIYLLRLFFSIY